jgi:predicted Zn-dependent peptidase
VATAAVAVVAATAIAAAAVIAEHSGVAKASSTSVTDRISRLDNGLTIATDRVHGARSVAIGVWVGVGSRDERPEQAGVSHFLEHLLFKGTPTRSATDISRSVDRVGGDINAFTAKEYTSYYCRLPSRHTAFGLELLGDVLTHSELTDKDVESERQVILEELAMDDDAPDDVALRTLTQQLFVDHGLGRDTAGERETVKSITADDVRTFFGAHYTTPVTVVALAGDVDHDDVVDAVQSAFADMPTTDGHIPRAAPAAVGENVDIDDDSEQVHLAIGGRSLRRDHPDREALDVVNHVFGGGLSSRLFDEIRERRGLAYSVYSATSAYADAGAWSVYAGAMPEHAGEVHGLVLSELERLVDGGITDEELAIAVGYLTGAYEMGLEDTGARMSRLGGMLVTLGAVRSVEDQLARWESVRRDDVLRVIRDVYGAAAPVTIAVGPEY